MNILSSSMSKRPKFKLSVSGIKPTSSTPIETSSCFFIASSSQSSSILLKFIKSTIKTQLIDKYYMVYNTMFKTNNKKTINHLLPLLKVSLIVIINRSLWKISTSLDFKVDKSSSIT